MSDENISTVTPIDPPRKPDGTPIYCVKIYLSGPTNEDAVARVLFPDVETKEKYINKEYRFCRAEEDAYNAARFLTHRERTKAELYAKRVTFAKQQNYAPKKGNKYEWVKQVNTPPTPNRVA